MLKFYKIKDTELRKVVHVDSNGTKTVTALIGQVEELQRRHIITLTSKSNLELCKNRWIVLMAGDNSNLRESITYATLADAKASFPNS